MIRSIFPSLDPEEQPRFRACAAAFGCVAPAALVARTAGDALFLSTYPASWLSYMYLATAFVISAVAFVFGIWASRVSVDRLIVRSGLAMVAVLIALRLGLAGSRPEFRIAAYVMGDVVAAVPMLLFWSFAALAFNPREAKRLFGFIGAAGTFGCIIVGFVVKPLATAFGTPNLLILAAALLLGFVAATRRLAVREASRFQSAVSGSGPNPFHLSYYASLLRSPQIRNLILLVLAATLTLTIVDFQFKASSRAHYGGPELAGFFGTFYAAASVAALLIQLFIVGPVLQKGGVFTGLIILPISLAAVAVGTLLTGTFEWMVATKFTAQVFLFTIDVAAVQMLYLGVARQSRSQARTFVEGTGKPLAMAAAGATLIGTASLLDLRWLAAGVLVGGLAWLLFTRANHRSYVAALVDSLGARRLDFSEEPNTFQDPRFTTHLRESLSTAPDEEIPYLLDLLPAIEEVDWAPDYRSLLRRADPGVKVPCLRYLAQNGSEEDLPDLIRHFTHEDPTVRAESLRASAELGGRDVYSEIEPSLEDANPNVRAAAVAILINSGDLDRLLNAGAVLRDMLHAQAAEDRLGAADALAHLRTRGLVRPIIGLLQDSEPDVRLAALRACRMRPDPELIPAVAPLLSDPLVARAASDTLVAFGHESLDHLVPYLELSGMGGAFTGAHHVPDILARIGDLAALPHLLKASEEFDLHLRAEAVAAFASLIASAPSVRPHRQEIERSARREIDSAAAHRLAMEEVAGLPGTEVLVDALDESYHSHLKNAFILLDLISNRVDMKAIYQGLSSRPLEESANALEVLDNVLEGDLKLAMMELLEQGPRKPPTDDPSNAAALRVTSLLEETTADWVTVGALYAAAENGFATALKVAEKSTGHQNPFVRETSLHTLSRLADSDSVKAAAARLSEDPDPGVRKLATELAA